MDSRSSYLLNVLSAIQPRYQPRNVLAPGEAVLAGLRPDGTQKGLGWLGLNRMTDGSGRGMTEYSLGFGSPQAPWHAPTLVPTLSPDELAQLLAGGQITPAIARKAYEHAMKMKRKGRSPFYD